MIISAGLLIYLLYYVGINAIVDEFNNILANSGLVYIVYALLIGLVAVLIMSTRWQVILRGYGYDTRWGKLFGYYLIGMFFNNFLPSTIGGDVIRVIKVVDDVQNKSSALASVIIERLMGVAATLFLAFLSLLVLWQEFHNPRLLYISGFLFLVIALFFFGLIRNRPFKYLVRIFDTIKWFNIGEKFNRVFEAIHYFQKRRRILAYAFIYSLFSQAGFVIMNYALAHALKIEISLTYLFLVVMVTFIITILPSINGIGIREFGFISLLSRVGVSNATALSLSFMNLIIPMIISLSGAVLFVLQKHKPSEVTYEDI
ncbi:MAG: flippase-like domain-containing protein [Calditrichaceae bacterium]|nr:flippase-like domain-containing protein [Calditrichaceae bacterium]